jgi:hypothetical protein
MSVSRPLACVHRNRRRWQRIAAMSRDEVAGAGVYRRHNAPKWQSLPSNPETAKQTARHMSTMVGVCQPGPNRATLGCGDWPCRADVSIQIRNCKLQISNFKMQIVNLHFAICSLQFILQQMRPPRRRLVERKGEMRCVVESV